MILRPYQLDLKRDIYQAWQAGHRNVLAVLPTGGGKTVVFSDIIAEHNGASVALVHRAELVQQMSLALARNGVRHRVIGPQTLGRICSQIHVADLGRSFTDPHARCGVASVDTLVRRDSTPWCSEVGLWVTDESAHLTRDNKWGQAVRMFPNARGLGVTATPIRADGKGLGAHADGVIHAMVEGPTMRELIRDGWLTDYRIFAPPSDLNLTDVPVSTNGEFSPPKLAEAVHKSHIVGDILSHYRKIADGKLAVVFCVDVQAAIEMSIAFKDAGIPTACITGGTPPLIRQHLLRQFKNREILVITSVDVFCEGTDIPAIEVVIMARPTASYGLYVQQFGRAVRTMEGKTHAIIIDAVSNTLRHGLPDRDQQWSLSRRERRSRSTPDDVIPVRACIKCCAVYERIHAACPYCGYKPEPASRSTPDAVDGDLLELTPEALARLRGEIDKPLTVPFSATPAIRGALAKHHRERATAQSELRRLMGLWGGWRTVAGDDVRTQQRRFWHTMGTDCLSAMTLPRAEAETLTERVRKVLQNEGVNCEE